MRLVLLHTNDFHGSLTPEKSKTIHELKERDHALYFDSGDCIKTGNLGVPLRTEPVWSLLAQAGCDASVPGNRESHVLESVHRAKFEGATHPILCANLRTKDGKEVFPSHLVLEHQGVRVGVIGVMVPMVTDRMKTAGLSAYLWTPPIPAVQALARELRNRVACLIALTHIGIREDEKLAEAVPELDFILGGHSHTVLELPKGIGQTTICQGGSHGKFVGRYVWEKGPGLIEGGLLPL